MDKSGGGRFVFPVSRVEVVVAAAIGAKDQVWDSAVFARRTISGSVANPIISVRSIRLENPPPVLW